MHITFFKNACSEKNDMIKGYRVMFSILVRDQGHLFLVQGEALTPQGIPAVKDKLRFYLTNICGFYHDDKRPFLFE
jgi:hypothetical protein